MQQPSKSSEQYIYLGDFVLSDTLDWEAKIPAMAFAYKTTMQEP
jgi:hypothetical protein